MNKKQERLYTQQCILYGCDLLQDSIDRDKERELGIDNAKRDVLS
jgi:hypothetical protein